MLRLAALFLVAATAQGQSVSDRERFQLFNECRPIVVAVERLFDEAKEIGLTEERLRLAAESRLRAARLYTDSRKAANQAFLYIRATLKSGGFSMTVDYHKLVFDRASGESGLAGTWHSSGAGRYGPDGSANFLVQVLSGHLDEFLAEYLRVNAPYCK